jgi:uncharacterized protein YbcC (UPF0753/DUF2309 family)
MYLIVKHIENEKTGKKLPVILIDSQCEVLEYENEDDANKMRDLFQANSDSNHIYEVKKV